MSLESAMRDHPIIFSAPMVLALLAGRKTQTRRLAWRDPDPLIRTGKPSPWQRVKPGDRLWVRESLYIWGRWRQDGLNKKGLPRWRFEEIGRRADPDPAPELIGTRGQRHIEKFWLRPSIHMPRWASRLTLTVTEVRVQRLQEISRWDARAEGIRPLPQQDVDDPSCWWECEPGQHQARTPTESFRLLWSSLHDDAPARWEDDPEVVALTFTVARRNIDA
jgi:hypothetical protein